MCYRYVLQISSLFFFFFFNDTATTEIYTLSLHDALPISSMNRMSPAPSEVSMPTRSPGRSSTGPDVVRMLTPSSFAMRRARVVLRSEEHTSELQSRLHLVCRLLLEKKNKSCLARTTCCL